MDLLEAGPQTHQGSSHASGPDVEFPHPTTKMTTGTILYLRMTAGFTRPEALSPMAENGEETCWRET